MGNKVEKFKKGASPFRIKSETPDRIPQAERTRRIIEALQLLQPVERDYIGLDEVTAKITHDRPVMLMTVADLHVGSIATDYDKIDELREMILANPDIAVVLLGDEFEGLKGKYLDTNEARTIGDVHQQIDLVKDLFIGPLAEEGRILGMVSGYWGHPGWAQDSATINTWMMMADDYGIPIIRNGGVLNIQYANGHEQSMRIFHNPPGKSKHDPVFGLRQVLQNESLPSRPNMAAAGHTHRAGAAKEYQPNIPRSAARPQAEVVVNTGTVKGSSAAVPPDRFGVKLGFPLADELGQGVILSTRKRNTGRRLEANYPFITREHGLVAFSAIQLLDRLEQQGMTDEMIGRIHDEVEDKPEITFMDRSSKRVAQPYDENPDQIDEDTYQRWDNGGLVHQYDQVRYNVDTKLPIAIDFIQNIRMGSNSEGSKALERYMQSRFMDNPHAFMAFLRNLVDTDAAKDPKRRQILEKLIKLGAEYPEQVLVLMHDKNLRLSRWKKPVGDEPDAGPIPAGTYLAKGMDAQLIRHESVIELAVGPGTKSKKKPNYSVLTLDKLKGHGSGNRPTFGHSRIYDLYAQRKPGVVVGGHLANSGFSTRFDRSNPETDNPYFIQPGWWANTVNTMGKGNAGPGSMPGQAIILLPGTGPKDYMAFATANPEETKYLHEALLLWQGLGFLGLREDVQ
jgi:hypothetical protein